MDRASLVAFRSQLVEVEEEFWAGTVTIGGTDYAATVKKPTEGGSLGLGREVLEAILKVRLKKSLYPTKPEHGSTLLTYDSKTWRVDEVTDDDLGASWYLTCIPASEA